MYHLFEAHLHNDDIVIEADSFDEACHILYSEYDEPTNKWEYIGQFTEHP